MEALVLAVAWTKDQRPLLDLRPREAFQRAHLKGSTSLPYALLLHRGACPPLVNEPSSVLQ